MTKISYSKNIIIFDRTNKNETTGSIYAAKNVELKINDLEIQLDLIINLKIIEKPSKWKSNTRIETWNTLNDYKKRIASNILEKYIWPIFSKLINICDNQFNLFLISNEKLPSEFNVNINEEIFVIPKSKILNKQDIQLLLSNNENKLKIFDTTFLDSLDNFISKWKQMISENKIENDFRKLLFENIRLFPAIFGIDDINGIYNSEFQKESKLSESLENRTDISNNNFCIELKRPDTKIFDSKNSRNNIEGLHSSLVSAANQLNLYLLKNDREKGLELFNFTKGVLIIGSYSEFKDQKGNLLENKILSWNLFRQNYKIDILTFDDIIKRLENLKTSITNLKPKYYKEEKKENSIINF